MSESSVSALVLVEDYPNNEGGVALMYVHTRNLYYRDKGMHVTVLNFRARDRYEYDGIRVISPREYDPHEHYDVLILHAANIKHHYVFLRKNEHRFNKIVFFYHGHEVLKINEAYSKPYSYVYKNIVKLCLQDLYDDFKLFVWRHYLPKIAHKSKFIFVSQWMKNEFYKWTRISPDIIEERSLIIYNGVGKEFEDSAYKDDQPHKYDFITIRSYMDNSKYAIDLVNDWASNTPEGKFLVVGTGSFFDHFEKAENITWLNTTLSHQEIKMLLNDSRFALMPTRTDAQGLMMCEMAAFGIPVITSDIPVCHEIFDGFSNAFFVPNDSTISLDYYLSKNTVCEKDARFFKSATLNNEYKAISDFIMQ